MARLSVSLSDAPDVIKVDVPLFIRLLEWAREDVDNDMPLHVLAENAVQLMTERPAGLAMSDYAQLISGTQPASN